MLNFFRQNVSGIIIKVIAVIIVASFIFGSVSTIFLNKPKTPEKSIAELGDYKLTYKTVAPYLQEALLKIKKKQDLSDKQKLKIANYAVNTAILVQGINHKRRTNKHFDNLYIKNALHFFNLINKEDKIDVNILDKYATSYGLTNRKQAIDFLVSRYTYNQELKYVKNALLIEDKYIDNLVQRASTVRDFSYIKLDPDKFIDTETVDEEKALEYYHANEDDYMAKPTYKLSYLLVTPQTYAPNIEEEEAQEYYDNNQSQFVIQEQVKLQAIFIAKNDPKVDDKINSLSSDLEQDELDFTKLVHKYSAHSKEDNGMLSWLNVKSLPSSIKKAVEPLEKDDITKIVATTDGYNVFKLIGKKPEQTQTFEQAKNKIIATLSTRVGKKLMKKAAEDLQEEIFAETSTLDELALNHDLNVKTAEIKDIDDETEFYLSNSQVKEHIQNEEVGSISNVIEFDKNKRLIIKVDKVEKARLYDFEEVKPLIVNKLARTNAATTVKELAQSIVEETISNEDLTEKKIKWIDKKGVFNTESLDYAKLAFECEVVPETQTKELDDTVYLFKVSREYISEDIEEEKVLEENQNIMFAEIMSTYLLSLYGKDKVVTMVDNILDPDSIN